VIQHISTYSFHIWSKFIRVPCAAGPTRVNTHTEKGLDTQAKTATLWPETRHTDAKSVIWDQQVCRISFTCHVLTPVEFAQVHHQPSVFE